MTMTRRDAMFAAALVGAAMAVGAPAWALSENDARSHVQTTIDELVALLKEPGEPVSKAPKLRAIMEQRTNVPQLARFSAGRSWRDMSDDQQARFVDAFARYLSITYSRRFQEYSGDPNIAVSRTIDAGKKGIVVQSPITPADAPAVSVEWLVSDRGGRVEIVDLVIEGISMAASQREEMAAKLQSRGGDIEALIEDLATTS